MIVKYFFFDENFIITIINPFGEKANVGAMKYFEELLECNIKAYSSISLLMNWYNAKIAIVEK